MLQTLPLRATSSILRRSTHKAGGFTIVELMVTIAILTVVSAALMYLIQSFYKDNAYLLEETTALNNARQGIDDAIIILREVSYGDDGSYPIVSAATSSITVYADLDNDSSVEKIYYYIAGTTLYRAVYEASGNPPVYSSTPVSSTTLAADVRNTSTTPLFTYYDDSGTQLATTSPNISSISSIQVQLLVDLNPNRAPNVFTLSQIATLRNLRNQ